MAFKTLPPQPISEPIEAMRANTEIHLIGCNPSSVKAIASRLAAKLKREYRTKFQNGGVTVWRLR